MVYKLLVVSVGGQWQCYAPFSGRIRLHLVHEVAHLDGVQLACAANDGETLAPDVGLTQQELAAIVIVPVLFLGARVVLHALKPHPHERVLAYGAWLGLALDAQHIDTVTQK